MLSYIHNMHTYMLDNSAFIEHRDSSPFVIFRRTPYSRRCLRFSGLLWNMRVINIIYLCIVVVVHNIITNNWTITLIIYNTRRHLLLNTPVTPSGWIYIYIYVQEVKIKCKSSDPIDVAMETEILCVDKRVKWGRRCPVNIMNVHL